MSLPDISFGIDAGTMDAAAATIYRQLYPNVFTGSQHVSKDGLEFDVSWDVKAPPKVVLGVPSDGSAHAVLREHLAEFTPPPGIDHAAIVDAYVAELEDTTFQLVIDDMKMTIAGQGSATVPVTVTIYVHAESAAGKLQLKPLKAVGTAPSPDDEWFLNAVILPEAMRQAQQMFPGIDLPPLSFGSIALTAPAVTFTGTHAIAMANLAGSPVPQPPYPDTWPQSPFFAVLSQAARMRVAQDGTAQVRGKTFGDQGSVDIGIGTAQYGATARIDSVNVGLGGMGTDFEFTGVIGGNVHAGITIGCTTFGVNYTLFAKPDPHGIITMQLSGRSVSARTSHLDVFVLLITPDGGVVEWLLSALTTPLLQVVAAAFSPLISQAFNGLAFAVMDLPSVPISTSGVNLVVTPSDVHFGSLAGLLTVEGQATITGG